MAENKTDPVSELIKALTVPIPVVDGVPAKGGQLAEAGGLIPGRAETKVEDLLNSPELERFRSAYQSGFVQAVFVDQVFALLRDLLVARGII